MKSLLLIVAGTLSALVSVFFFHYTARLVYVNLTAADAAAHRSGGMLIGAVAFAVAVHFGQNRYEERL